MPGLDALRSYGRTRLAVRCPPSNFG